jgi:DNA-directed RNA polymerase specialized sigma24 family protein
MEGTPEPLASRYKRVELTLAVDALLDELGKESPQQRSVVESKFFLDLSDEDAAQALNLTLHTFQREWYRARRWLFERLNAKPSQSARGESARGATTA